LGGKGQDFVIAFIKSIFAQVTKAGNENFPGGWINSLRKRNKCSTDIGLFYKLGYSEKVPSLHKVKDIIFNEVLTREDGKKVLSNISTNEKNKRNCSFIEYRTAVHSLTPMINPGSDVKFDKQVSEDSLKIRDAQKITTWTDNKFHAYVDAVNVAFAIKSSLDDKKSKSTPLHYEQARNRVLHMSAHLPLVDSQGKSYESVMKVDSKIESYLRTTFKYPKKDTSKRGPEEQPPPDGDEEMDEDPSSTQEPEPKRTRSSRATTRKMAATAPGKPTKWV
jgi:hypothetical protein